MVTGIETAGLVLASFPLIVEGLKYYQQGIDSIKDMRQYASIIEKYQLQLDIELIKFNNTCEKLLETTFTAEELQQIDSSVAFHWGCHTFREKLVMNIGATASNALLRTLESLQNEIKMFGVMLALDSNEKPGSLDKKTLKRRLKGVLRALKKQKCSDISDHIRRMNEDLATLTGQSNIMNDGPAKGRMSDVAAKHYQKIRSHAITLYTILKQELKVVKACACPVPHSAGLQLDVRSATMVTKQKQSSGLRFGVILSLDQTAATPTTNVPWEWRPIEIEPVENIEEIQEDIPHELESLAIGTAGLTTAIFASGELSVPEAIEINNLCLDTRNAPFPNGDGCLGILKGRGTCCHRVWPHPSATSTTPIKTAISLAVLLSSNTPFTLSRLDRLKVGVMLASTVMQLHATEWLRRKWDVSDILFPATSSDKGYTCITKRPFVRRNFTDSAVVSPATDEDIHGVDPTLFSLGIALVELGLGKRLSVGCATTSSVEHQAFGSLKFLYEDSGETYSRIVRRCLKGFDHAETSLEEVKIKNQVHRDILKPLEDNLLAFCGAKSLEKVLA
ncbi:hypothetical protein EDC01DRAFT_624367 [Geopyxis carbonaria]|nr:hypothetical protein EDC01DRAFT_624367 [Geopyxis carbonaria]